MSPPTNNWGQKRAEHRFNAEIVTDITTQRHIVGQHKT
jgi:hypothetical protein